MCFKAGTQAGRGICESIPDKLGGYGQSKGSRFISFITGEKILDFFYFFLLTPKAMILQVITMTEILFSYLWKELSSPGGTP